jgi:hypothetical protein
LYSRYFKGGDTTGNISDNIHKSINGTSFAQFDSVFMIKVKVKQSLCRLGQTLRAPGV